MKTRDRPRSERALIDAFVADLRGVLPAGWSISASGEQALGRMRADAVIDLTAPGGQSAQVLVEAKTTLAPRAVASAVDQLRAIGALLPGGEYTPLVLSRFLSPRVRQMLSDQGVSWADATGNLSLAVKRPAVFVQRQGAAVDPWAERTPVRSLRGRGAAATVRALCDFAPPYTVSELATRARLPLASVYRTVDFLATEALLQKQSQRGQITVIDWVAILRRWTQDYALLTSNSAVSSFIDPRGTAALLPRLAPLDEEYALTGSAVAEQVAPVAPARLVVVYSRTPAGLGERLGLTPVGSGANVLLVEPFAPAQMERTTVRGGLRCAALSQVAADLLTSPGRGPSEAEALLEWMQANESEWRA